MRREIPLLITAVLGVFVVLSFFIPHPFVQDTAETLRNWFIIIAAFAFVLGMGNLIRVNLHRIRHRGEDWPFKIATLVALFGYLLIGLVVGTDLDIRSSWLTRGLGLVKPDREEILTGELRLSDPVVRAAVLEKMRSGEDVAYALRAELAFRRDQAEAIAALGPEGVAKLDPAALRAELQEIKSAPPEPMRRQLGNWIFYNIYTPLQATMFSLLAFFIASAAFRAFRMRTVEAGVLLTAGILVMFGRVPLGQFDWGIAKEEFGFHTIMNWIMNVPTTAAMRGITMGAAMGVIVMGLKVILGIERSYLGGD